MKRSLIATIIFLFASQLSFADLRIHNNTSYSVILTLGYYQDGVAISQGWFIFQPGETKVVNESTALSRYYFYYAIGNGNQVWCGDHNFYISDSQSFKIQGEAYSMYINVKKKGFRPVDLGDKEIKDYTITLNQADISSLNAGNSPKSPRGGGVTKGNPFTNKP
jgi:uncharacterized membrane protein